MNYHHITDAMKAIRTSQYIRAFTDAEITVAHVAKWMVDNGATPEQAYRYYLAEGLIRDPDLDALLDRREALRSELAQVNSEIAKITPVVPS